jgi:hypothetical protein
MFDLLDEKLSEPVKQEVEEHLEQCEACAERLANMKDRQEKEKSTGLFWYLLAPSGGFKRFFFIGAIFTFILVLALISVQLKKPLFQIF